MRIVFFGCDDFAAVNLERLIADGHELVALVTQPDKPKGRGMHMVYSATKELALKACIEVFQPVTLKDPDVVAQLKAYRADMFVVVAYGKLLPEAVLELPKFFCVNVHPSLLPRYRGAAPINWPVINGDKETGVTLIRMSPAMDGGDILAQVAHPLPDHMTSAELREHLAVVGSEILSRSLAGIPAGAYALHKQDDTKATRAPKLHKGLGHISWERSAHEIHNLVRGTQPWPGAFTSWRGAMLKILSTEVVRQDLLSGMPGEVVALHKDDFRVRTGDGVLAIKKVHPANGKPMDARAFLSGHRLVPGEVFF